MDSVTREHSYAVDVEWAAPGGTSSYRGYSRDHLLGSEATAPIAASADPHFLGSPALWNPEQLLVAAAASCHMLSYLALCARHGVIVLDYVDAAEGTMSEAPGGGGRFTSIVLRPRVTVTASSDVERARTLHRAAAEQCYIAASLAVPVHHEPEILVDGQT